MIKERAIVIGLSGNIAEVQTKRQIACSQCEAGRGCGIGAIGRLFGKRNKPIKIKVDQDLKPGDQIEIGLSDKAFLRAGLLIYGTPLLSLFIGLMLAELISSSSDLIAFTFAFIGLVLGLFISASVAKSNLAYQLNPKILAVTNELED
jgi:sigma-E factor negative regulatory protein RseC